MNRYNDGPADAARHTGTSAGHGEVGEHFGEQMEPATPV
eukprot:SAG31_NODE_42310_length_272_cov_0.601156_2_plen_38_part_01